MKGGHIVRTASLFLFVVVVASLALFAYGPAVSATASVEQRLTPWEGFSSFTGRASGLATNPAALMDLDENALRLQTVRPLASSQPDGMVYTYLEPDMGLGAGQLGYMQMSEGNDRLSRFVYSGAKRAGASAAVGLSVTYTQLRSGPAPADALSTWGLDVGFRSVLFNRLALGAVVQNAYLLGDESGADAMPPQLAAGLALDLGAIVVAGDYLLRGRAAPFTEGYKYGVEGRFGRLLARYGQRSVPEDNFTYSGLGYRFDRGHIDVTVGERETGRSLSLGLSLYF